MKKDMRLFATLAAVLSLAALSLSFSSPVQDMKGTIKFFGNVPFEYPGFEAEDGSQYTLEVMEGAEFSLEDMGRHSGELMEISGKLKKKKRGGLSSLPGGHIVVEAYELLEATETAAD